MPLPLLRRLLPALVIVPSVAVLASSPALPGQEGRGSREQSMFVTVTGTDGLPVTGLSPAEFVVREDGRRREVLTAAPATDPVTIALMVDNSAAAASFVADERRALEPFVKRVGGKNPTAVTAIAERPTILADYTLDKDALVKGVQRIFSIPGSAAYFVDGVRELSRGLMVRDFRRAVIVAITAEGPEYSDSRYTETIPLLKESGAALEAFVLNQPGGPDMSEDGARSRSIILDQGTRETGGNRTELLSSMALEQALAGLAARLEGQYEITYARPESLIPPERIEVSVTRPGLEARGTPARTRK